MKRSEWNKIVHTWEDAAKAACLAARAHERAIFMLAEAKSQEEMLRLQADIAERDLRHAVMAYGEAARQVARDGGTEEDKAEAARSAQEESDSA